MAHSEFYAEYAEKKIAERRTQTLSRAHMFLIIDVLLFIVHATFISIDLTFGQATMEEPSALHMIIHFLSLVVLIACLFLHVNIYNTISSSAETSLHRKFIDIIDAARVDEATATKLAHESMYKELVHEEESLNKAMRYLDWVEYFTCGACCLLLLMAV